MKTKPIIKIISKIPPVLCMLLSASCGDYEGTTPVTSSQEITNMAGVPRVSGRPALRTPAKIGVFTTGRTDSLDFGAGAKHIKAEEGIQSLQSINAFVPERDYYQLNDVLAKRAKLIHDTRFLGLDVILVCDQQTQSDSTTSLVGLATLGILDVGMRKQDTQLTVICMDARTGYVYGVMGRQEDGHTTRLALFDTSLFSNPNRSHLVQTTRRDAVKGFPEFWKQVVDKYKR